MMKKYSKQEVDQRRDWMKNQSYQEVPVKLAGNEFSYFVIPQSLNDHLPNFAYVCAGVNPEDSYVIGVSDSVP